MQWFDFSACAETDTQQREAAGLGHVGDKEAEVSGTGVLSYCENQTGLASDGFKEFCAIQVTKKTSTSYVEVVPADWRLALSKRKHKKRGGTGRTRSRVVLLQVWSGWGWVKPVPTREARYRPPQLRRNLQSNRVKSSDGHQSQLRVQCLWKAMTSQSWMRHKGWDLRHVAKQTHIQFCCQADEKRRLTSKSKVHSPTFTSRDQPADARRQQTPF